MIYDLEYFEKMLRQNSKTALVINEIRWKWIAELKPKYVLDYGSGVGWFRAFRPNNIFVDTYDIADYPQTGIHLRVYDIVCFWDVLEHISNFDKIEPVLRLSNYVASSVPVKPTNKPYLEWKHLKPTEHLHLWDIQALNALFEKFGFSMIKSGYPECPPREDIFSAIYKRNDQPEINT